MSALVTGGTGFIGKRLGRGRGETGRSEMRLSSKDEEDHDQ
jgi:FlaA1/EpsC-like NDP-sugar epimerase